MSSRALSGEGTTGPVWESRRIRMGSPSRSSLTSSHRIALQVGIGSPFWEWTLITDVGLNQLTELNQLQELGLNQIRVSVAGLKCLTRLKRLRELNLCHSGVTDAGLEVLAELKQLQSLDLS